MATIFGEIFVFQLKAFKVIFLASNAERSQISRKLLLYINLLNTYIINNYIGNIQSWNLI